MAKALKLVFTAGDKNRTISINCPKEVIEQDDARAAMETIAASGAFDGITGVEKAVLTETTDTVIYEA